MKYELRNMKLNETENPQFLVEVRGKNYEV